MIRSLAMVAAAAVCPQKLDIDPREWKEALINAAPGSKEQAALIEQLGFRKVPSGSDLIPDAECIEQPVVKGVDLFPAKLTGRKDMVVQARFEMCAEEPQAHFWSLRIAVLRPLPGGGSCRLGGEDPSIDAPASDVCGGPSGLPRTFEFVRLTGAQHDTLELDDHLDECPGSAHSVTEAVSYLDASGDELAKLFSIKTHEAAWDAPDEPAQTIARTVTPAGKFPRKLRVVEEVHCPDGKETPTCKPARRTAIYALRGGRYVPE